MATEQWTLKVKIQSLDRGSVVVKNRWEVGEKVTVQIEPHATVNMLKQRIGLLIAAHPKHQIISNGAGVALDDIAKVEDCEGVTDGCVMLVDVVQPKEEEAPPVVVSDDEDVWEDSGDKEPLPSEEVLTKARDPDAQMEMDDATQDKINALKGEGAELLEDGDKAGALAKYSAAVMVGIPNAMLLCKRAEILLKMKRLRAAEADASAAIDINPDSAKAYRIRGKARRHLGDYDGAVADLNRAQAQDYDDGVADIHSYVQKRVAKIALKAKQDAAKAAAAEAESA